MGYLAGRVATGTLFGIEGEITKESVNEAFKNVKNFVSDIWCKAWYFDSTSTNGRTTRTSPWCRRTRRWCRRRCFDIAELPGNPLDIRAAEQEQGLNTATA